MADRKKFFDRFSARFESLDLSSQQTGVAMLMKERGFFETVFNAVDDGILVIDRQLYLRYFNRAAKELLALPEDTSSLRLSKLLPDVDWQQISDNNENIWSHSAREELQILYPQERFLQFYLTPLSGNAELATVILHDVTESRQRAFSDLERETVKAVSQLAAGVAHEIGNPLNSLSLNLQMLERACDNPEEDGISLENAAKMIRRCQSEVDRLDSIIHSFLSAIRPGKMNFAPVDLKETVFDVLTFMRPEIEARKVSVKCNWDVMPPVSGDQEQLKQAFYNIIRNAVQAMSNGGELEIFGYSTPDFRVLEFSDSGKGMDSEDLREMFVPFKTSKAGGNGIGTMIIERVCREHGAEFGVVSAEGKGTVFQLKFPDGRRRVRLLPGNSE